MCNNACPGLFSNESMPNIHMLLYADNVAMVNDQIGRLHCQLNKVREVCSKYSLSINISESWSTKNE